jgi:hypothetical protein
MPTPPIMTDDTQQGVLHELDTVLLPDWQLMCHNHGFRVAPPFGQRTGDDLRFFVASETWRIAQFVAYRPFVSITYLADGSYCIESRRDDGNGFQVIVDPNARELPNHRPRPLTVEELAEAGD